MSKLEPLVAAPHSPDNRKLARECRDVKIDRVYIGSCTGARAGAGISRRLLGQDVGRGGMLWWCEGWPCLHRQLASVGVVSVGVSS